MASELSANNQTIEGIAIPPTTRQASVEKIADPAMSKFQVIRRNGKVTGFDPNKIAVAMTKAFLAVEGGNAAASSRVHDTVKNLTDDVVQALLRRLPNGGTFHIEDIQDQVELALMRNGEHRVARSYVLYRASRAEERAAHAADEIPEEHKINITQKDGSVIPLDVKAMRDLVFESSSDLSGVEAERVLNDT